VISSARCGSRIGRSAAEYARLRGHSVGVAKAGLDCRVANSRTNALSSLIIYGYMDAQRGSEQTISAIPQPSGWPITGIHDSSNARTAWPAWSNRSDTRDPLEPAPPVTRKFMGR
jgi:hypothetical protein